MNLDPNSHVQTYLAEELMLAIGQIASESGEVIEAEALLESYPGMFEKTLSYQAHPADTLLLMALEQLHSKDVAERSQITKETIAYLVDFCIHTRFHIVLVESNLMKNERFNQYPEFVNKSYDREFVNSMRIRAINYLLLIALTNNFAKDALIALIKSLSEPHESITLATKEYFNLVKSLKSSLDLHKQMLERGINSPLFMYDASLIHSNLNEIEVTLKVELQEL